MSTITKEQAKDLRNAFDCWQQDYDPVEDKEQYDMFGLGMVAMDALLASIEAEPVSFDDLRDAVAEVSGGPAMEWSDIYKGHQAVPFINFNSLARIVDKFRTAPPAPVTVPDEREAFNAWNNDTDCPVAGRDAKTAAWLAWSRRAAMIQGADVNSPVIPDGPTSAAQFVKDYCKAAGWTEKEFYETQVPMPDITSPSGWAAVSNSPLSIKSHVDLYMRAAQQQEVK